MSLTRNQTKHADNAAPEISQLGHRQRFIPASRSGIIRNLVWAKNLKITLRLSGLHLVHCSISFLRPVANPFSRSCFVRRPGQVRASATTSSSSPQSTTCGSWCTDVHSETHSAKHAKVRDDENCCAPGGRLTEWTLAGPQGGRLLSVPSC